MNIVGVWPAAAAHERPRLLRALAELAGVRFEPLEGAVGSPDDLGAVLVLSAPEGGRHSPDSWHVPTLVLEGLPGTSQVAPVSFVQSIHVDPRLQGQTLLGNWSPSASPNGDASEVLALAGTEPVWSRRLGGSPYEVVSVDLPELGADEQLRHRMRPGHCLGVVALIQFMRGVFGREWSAPPTRACFLIDDPNTRKPTYGHIDYAELVRHADHFDYHIAFAQIPLDLGVFDLDTVALFREHPHRFSLVFHGNNHTRRELVTLRSTEEADRLLAQAIRRVVRFERRTGVDVTRVMVSPHGQCSELVLGEMARVGFESVTLANPRIPLDVTAGFEPAEVGMSRMPVLVRRKLAQRDQVILRAFLDQPIVLYGHETDFKAGLEFLEDAASVVNRMPGAAWHNLATISRSNFLSRRRGEDLEVKAFSRRIVVTPDPEVCSLIIQPLGQASGEGDVELTCRDGGNVVVSDSVMTRIVLEPSKSDVRNVTVQFASQAQLDPELIPDPAFRVSPFVRRFATETRDRSHPLRTRFSSRSK